MCAVGYVGRACAWPAAGYASSDATVFRYVECPGSRLGLLLLAAFLIGKDVLLFAVSSFSVLGAKAESKESGVLLNQLMSFATVNSICFMVIAQTNVYQQLKGFADNFLFGCGLAMDLARGQGGGGTSIACVIKAILGIDYATLWMRFFAVSVTPVMLIIMLSCLQDPWLAFIVGTNCFLPSLCGRAALHFVAYKPSEEEGVLVGDLAPGESMASYFLPVIATLMCFFAVTIWSWMRAVSAAKAPLPPHVLYISRAYKSEHAGWELERLLRKMLLALIQSAFPVTMHPVSLLALTSIVLMFSLVAYLKLKPYKKDAFNQLETLLLMIGVSMPILTIVSVAQTRGEVKCALVGMGEALAFLIISVLLAAGSHDLDKFWVQKMLQPSRKTLYCYTIVVSIFFSIILILPQYYPNITPILKAFPIVSIFFSIIPKT